MARGQRNPVLALTKEVEEPVSLTCSPQSPLAAEQKTTYYLKFEVLLKDMVTTSSVQRAFLGQVDETAKQKAAREVLQDRFSNQQNVLSKAPAEFARINFGFGVPPEYPIIKADDVPFLIASVENVGGEKLVRIKDYSFSLAERGFSSESSNCLAGYELPLPADAPRSFGLASCFVSLPADLKDFQGKPKVESFFATLRYDYAIDTETTVSVQELGAQ